MPAYFSARTTRRVAAGLIAIAAASVFGLAPQRADAADPIKVGLSLGLTGANAPNGGQLLLALQIWRDDVNAKGGLLGRPVALVYYDDQTNPSNEVTIYSKLLNVDKVDLLLGPYGTNQISAALPLLAQRNLTTIGIGEEGMDYPDLVKALVAERLHRALTGRDLGYPQLQALEALVPGEPAREPLPS